LLASDKPIERGLGYMLILPDHDTCDFSHNLSEAGGKACPQKSAFTFDATTPKSEISCLWSQRLFESTNWTL